MFIIVFRWWWCSWMMSVFSTKTRKTKTVSFFCIKYFKREKAKKNPFHFHTSIPIQILFKQCFISVFYFLIFSTKKLKNCNTSLFRVAAVVGTQCHHHHCIWRWLTSRTYHTSLFWHIFIIIIMLMSKTVYG